MITVGIHENLSLGANTKVNEKGTLELEIKSASGADAAAAALLGNTTMSSMEGKMLLYPANLTDFEKKPKSGPAILEDLLKIRHQLLQYAGIFGTEEETNAAIGGLAMFDGMGVTTENLTQAINQLTTQDYLTKVNTNLYSRFVQFLTAKNAFAGGVTFRQKFTRQSKAKHWATIPNSSFDVWIEPMTVPADQSKVKFSDWEVKNGKNDPNPVAASGSTANTAENQAKASSLFAQPAAPAESFGAAPAAAPAIPAAPATPPATEGGAPNLSAFGQQ